MVHILNIDVYGVGINFHAQGLHVIQEKEEWKDLKICKKMEPYTLVRLLLENGKVVKGWWTGHSWDGLHLRDHHTIVKWAPCKEENNWIKNKYYH